ncbi:hypothetical protein BGZ76_008166, partial [Entomortierella beljakovae]
TLTAALDKLRFTEHFELNAEQRKCFDSLKKLLACAPILYFADFSRPFYIATDASNVGLGA